MKILSIECSAGPASCAIIDDGKIKASSFVNAQLTHSQTLMQMIINTLDNSATKFSEIDEIAIAAGPGSFTGLRIGISAVKGLAAANKTPCVAISTLDGIAENHIGNNCVVCAVMDARCNQFYNALFEVSECSITRLCDDRALMVDELKDQVLEISKNKHVIISGDGADLFFKSIGGQENITLSPQHLKYQSAVGVGVFAYKNHDKLTAVSPENLLPIYLRLPQAERELKAKTEAKK